jgi:hypothetical protein
MATVHGVDYVFKLLQESNIDHLHVLALMAERTRMEAAYIQSMLLPVPETIEE